MAPGRGFGRGDDSNRPAPRNGRGGPARNGRKPGGGTKGIGPAKAGPPRRPQSAVGRRIFLRPGARAAVDTAVRRYGCEVKFT